MASTVDREMKSAAAADAEAEPQVVGEIDFRTLRERLQSARALDSYTKTKDAVIRTATTALDQLSDLASGEVDPESAKILLGAMRLALNKIIKLMGEEKSLVVHTREGDGIVSPAGYNMLRAVRDEVGQMSAEQSLPDVHAATEARGMTFRLSRPPRASPTNASLGDPAAIQPRSETPATAVFSPHEPARQKSDSSDANRASESVQQKPDSSNGQVAADVRLVPAGGTGWAVPQKSASTVVTLPGTREFPTLAAAASMPRIKYKMPERQEKPKPRFNFAVEIDNLFYEDGWSDVIRQIPQRSQ